MADHAAAMFAAKNAKSTVCLDVPPEPEENDGSFDDFNKRHSNSSSYDKPEAVHLRKVSKESAGSATNFTKKFGRQPSEVLEDLQQNSTGLDSQTLGRSNVSLRVAKSNLSAPESMPAIVLMNHGRFDDLSLGDIEDLFEVIDVDANGVLDFSEIRLLLKEVMKPPCTEEQISAIYALTDQNRDGTVTANEFLRALKEGPLKEHMKQLQKANKARKKLEEMLGLNAEVDRNLMLEQLKWIVGRDDAFRTLPFSLLYFCIFIYLVVAHLRIWDRQQAETGLQSWVNGYSGGLLRGPYLDAVSDVPGMWNWLEVSGLQAVFGNCRNSSAGLPKCQVGSRYVLLSDVEMKVTQSNGHVRSSWLLNLDLARTQKHLANQPMDYFGAAKLALHHLKSEGSDQMGVTDMQLTYSVFGVQAQLFAINKVGVHFSGHGQAVSNVISSAIIIRPYPVEFGWAVLCYMVDTLYILFLLLPVYTELKDLIRGMRINGICLGFRNYWGLWNVVDWVSIAMGTINIAMWMLCCQAMQDGSIRSLFIEGDPQLLLSPFAMMLETLTLESMHAAFERVISLFFMLHLSMGLTGVVIMLKFLKAFQANPRLQLVTDTLVKAGNDMFHFTLVFLLVFLGFAVTGHILFGNDLAEFRSFGASVDTAFVILMGEFGWYADISKHDQPLGSGLPRFVMILWFWLYVVFVLLIMINMLLAIVLEHYTQLRKQVVNRADSATLWQQSVQCLGQAMKRKQFIPNSTIVHLLDNDDIPCHTDVCVCQESLLKAFPGMKLEQAAWLMKWLRGEAIDRMKTKDDQVVARMKIMESFVENIARDLHIVNLNVAILSSKLDAGLSHDVKGGSGGSSNDISFCLPDQLIEQVQRLTFSLCGAVHDFRIQIEGASEALTSQSTKLVKTSKLLAPSFAPAGIDSIEDWMAKEAAKASKAAALQKIRQTPQQVPICFQSEATQ